MARRDQPLVQQLERRPGRQDHRWVHVLGPVETGETPAPPAVDREAPIADSPEARDDRVRATYGVVAASYARELSDELDGLPFERWLLDRVAVAARDLPVMDAGCGPGHVTAHLAAAGADARGLDVSPEMIAEAPREALIATKAKTPKGVTVTLSVSLATAFMSIGVVAPVARSTFINVAG